MLSLVSRISRVLTAQNSLISRNAERLLASFTPRDIIHESSDETGTLLIRFAKYIAIDTHKHMAPVATTIRYADFFPISNVNYFQQELNKTAADQVPFLIIFAYTYRSNADPVKFATVLNEIDALAVKRLPDMDPATIYRTLYALLFLMPNWITRTDFYRAGVRLLAQHFGESAQPEEFVQLCFYCGLEKKHHQSTGSGSAILKKLLNEHLDRYLIKLSPTDLAIVSNAAYKTATKIANANYQNSLIRNTLQLPLDNTQDDVLVTFLKAMRLERVQSDDICEYLARLCANTDVLRRIQARGLIHIFAYFAENSWDEEKSTTPLVAEFIERLRKMKKFATVETLRPKDIDTFTWCCAQLNIQLSDADMQQVERVVLEKNRHKEFQYFPEQLVDTCLNMWILGYRSRYLLEETVHHKGIARSNARQQPKVDSRYTVLLSAAAIEQPDWIERIKEAQKQPFSLNKAPPPHLKKMWEEWRNYAQEISTNTDVSQVDVVCPIRGINIPSLYVELNESTYDASIQPSTDNIVFIELLTNDRMLRFSGEPTAILRLKIRLLKYLGYKVILLRPQDLPENICKLRNLIPADDVAKDDVEKAETLSV